MFVDNKKYGLFVSSNRFSSMGLGYSLFFLLAKMAIILSLFPFGISSAYYMYRNYKGNDCIKQDHPLMNDHKEFDPIFLNKHTKVSSKNTKNDVDLELFIKGFCYPHYIFGHKRCSDFKNKNCYDLYTPECQQIAKEVFWKNYKENQCYRSSITELSLGNRVHSIKNEKNWEIKRLIANSFTILICFILVIYFSFLENRLSRIAENLICTTGDYSVMITHLPKLSQEFYETKDLKELLYDLLTEKGYNVEQINFCFRTKEYTTLKEKFAQLKMEKYAREYKISSEHSETYTLNQTDENKLLLDQNEKTEEKLYTTKQKLKEMEKAYDNGYPEYFNGEAFVSFIHKSERDKILDEYKIRGPLKNYKIGFARNQLHLKIKEKDYKIRVESAPEPTDVIWKNIGYSRFNCFMRRLLISLLSFFLIIASILIITSLDFFLVKIFLTRIITRGLSKPKLEKY